MATCTVNYEYKERREERERERERERETGRKRDKEREGGGRERENLTYVWQAKASEVRGRHLRRPPLSHQTKFVLHTLLRMFPEER